MKCYERGNETSVVPSKAEEFVASVIDYHPLKEGCAPWG
jgi:hypothetical protein